MEPEIKTTRQVIRNLESSQKYRYLINKSSKMALGFTQSCLEDPQQPEQFTEMLGLDCEMIQTTSGEQIVRAVIVEADGSEIYNKWFQIQEGTQVTDYLTHITGIDAKKLNEHAQEGSYSQQHIDEIQGLIKGKILVGHDLANDLRVLKISHNAFIDTVALLPHSFGLPLKYKLKHLAMQLLQKNIQWGSHDPKEDAVTSLEIVEDHIRDGRGTIQVEPFQQKHYGSVIQIIKDAQLNPEKLVFFALRGSRALGIEVNTKQYQSDWDYIVVYDTTAKLDGRLIRLPNIDISFFDQKSFSVHIERNNDISYLEAFSLPKEYIYINKLRLRSEIDLGTLRGSLGYHMNKCRLKAKRFLGEVGEKPGYAWKILKSMHLKLRFMDNFIQIQQQLKENIEKEGEQPEMPVIDVKRMNPVWKQISEQYMRTGKLMEVINSITKREKEMMKRVAQVYSLSKSLRYRNQEGDKMSKPKGAIQFNQGYCGSAVNLNFNPVHLNLQTVRLLQKHGLGILEQYKISFKQHKRHDNLFQLKYLMSASFKSKPPRQCRGMIVDASRSYEVVALPYYKFFDYNDPNWSQSEKFDWASARVYEKKDGSIAFLYFYAGNWQVASSSVPDGDNNYCFSRKQTTIEFRKEFWRIFNELGFQQPDPEDQDKTFIFELMSQNHIIVVKREKSDLCLHGVRSIRTLEEEDHLIYGKKYNWNVTRPLQFSQQELNLGRLVSEVEKMDPLKCEGFVVCDKNWVRMKIKSSGYVRVNWLGELNLGFNKDPRKYILIQIVLSGEAEVFCQYCPEWKGIILEYLNKIAKLNQQIKAIYQNLRELDQKQFAQEIRHFDRNIQAMLFAIRSNEKLYYGQVEGVLNPKKFYQFITEFEGININKQ